MIQTRPTTRHAILEAAFDVFSRDGSASLSDVAAAAGVGRATLHRHFAGRADLFAALTETAMRELDEAVARAVAPATSWTASLRLSLEAIIPLANRQLFLEQEPAAHTAEQAKTAAAQRAELVEAIEHAKAEGGFDPAIPTSWIAETFDALVYAGWSAVQSGALTPAQAADLAWRTLINGVGGSPE